MEQAPSGARLYIPPGFQDNQDPANLSAALIAGSVQYIPVADKWPGVEPGHSRFHTNTHGIFTPSLSVFTPTLDVFTPTFMAFSHQHWAFSHQHSWHFHTNTHAFSHQLMAFSHQHWTFSHQHSQLIHAVFLLKGQQFGAKRGTLLAESSTVELDLPESDF